MDYRKYLKSKEWHSRKQWALKYADYKCQTCNSDEQIDVHHRTYENLGYELPGDLTILCHRCHKLLTDAGIMKNDKDLENIDFNIKIANLPLKDKINLLENAIANNEIVVKQEEYIYVLHNLENYL